LLVFSAFPLKRARFLRFAGSWVLAPAEMRWNPAGTRCRQRVGASRSAQAFPASTNMLLLVGLPSTCYSGFMLLHEQVRDARIAHGLSQVKLAKLAGVPRSQLRNFENGEGITLTTFLKIIGQLPNLERLTLGPTELQLQNIDLEALRGTLTELIAAAAGVLAVLQAASPGPAADADAVRHQPTISERQRAEELNAIALAMAGGGGKGPPVVDRS
jgi:transcriptional regulator with XRE-family HTH domain